MNKSNYNIALTNLSLLSKASIDKLSRKEEASYTYNYDINGLQGQFCGLMTNEAGIKYIIDELASNNDSLDEVYCIATQQISENIQYTNEPLDKYKDKSHFDLFKQQIEEYCLEKGVSVPKIHIGSRISSKDPQSSELMNLSGEIVGKLLTLNTTLQNKETKLYIDSNGGFREFILIVVAVLRTMDKNLIELKRIIGANLLGSSAVVVDKTIAYQVYDLYSGIDEFINYGRSEKLEYYFKHSDIKLTKEMKKVLKAISHMSDSFTLCRPTEMIQYTIQLKNAIDSYNENQTSNIFTYLTQKISSEYALIFNSFNGTNDTSFEVLKQMILFCLNHNLIQQAMTLYSERMPIVFYDYEIMTMKNDSNFIIHYNQHNTRLQSNLQRPIGDIEKKYNFIQQYMLVQGRNSGGLAELYKNDKQIKSNVNKLRMLELMLNDGYVYSKYKTCDVVNVMKKYLNIKDGRNKSNHASADLSDVVKKYFINSKTTSQYIKDAVDDIEKLMM